MACLLACLFAFLLENDVLRGTVFQLAKGFRSDFATVHAQNRHALRRTGSHFVIQGMMYVNALVEDNTQIRPQFCRRYTAQDVLDVRFFLLHISSHAPSLPYIRNLFGAKQTSPPVCLKPSERNSWADSRAPGRVYP